MIFDICVLLIGASALAAVTYFSYAVGKKSVGSDSEEKWKEIIDYSPTGREEKK